MFEGSGSRNQIRKNHAEREVVSDRMYGAK